MDGIEAWSGLELIERIEEGNRNEVWRGRIGDRRVAVRRSRRAADSLAWELDLLHRLAAADFVVPDVVPTDTGATSHHGVVVQRWIDGHAPTSTADWTAVADELQRLHHVLRDHPQRPGCVAVTELDRTATSVDADMGALPEAVAVRTLAIFHGLRDAPHGVIHGDAGASNLRIQADGRVGLLDFDESRRDVLWHDLSELGVQVLADADHERARQLSNAWEAVNAWIDEPDYARERLAQLEA